MSITEESFRRILDDKLGPIQDDVCAIRKSLYGDDGRGGIIADVAETNRMTRDHKILLKGPNGNEGIVADAVMCKRIFKFLGAGGIIGAAIKAYHEIFIV